MAKSIKGRGQCEVCHKQMPDPDDLKDMWWWRVRDGHVSGRAEPLRVCMAKECRAAAEARGFSTERYPGRSAPPRPAGQ
jgi:hypothetical protein